MDSPLLLCASAAASAVPPGYWGTVTSTVDWCERNYAFTPYVAELFNSASSLAMVAAGVLGIALHRGVLERRFLLASLKDLSKRLKQARLHGRPR